MPRLPPPNKYRPAGKGRSAFRKKATRVVAVRFGAHSLALLQTPVTSFLFQGLPSSTNCTEVTVPTAPPHVCLRGASWTEACSHRSLERGRRAPTCRLLACPKQTGSHGWPAFMDHQQGRSASSLTHCACRSDGIRTGAADGAVADGSETVTDGLKRIQNRGFGNGNRHCSARHCGAFWGFADASLAACGPICPMRL